MGLGLGLWVWGVGGVGFGLGWVGLGWGEPVSRVVGRVSIKGRWAKIHAFFVYGTAVEESKLASKMLELPCRSCDLANRIQNIGSNCGSRKLQQQAHRGSHKSPSGKDIPLGIDLFGSSDKTESRPFRTPKQIRVKLWGKRPLQVWSL